MKSLYLFVAAVCCMQSAVSQDLPGAYDFKTKPGTESWKKLTSHDAMIRACQIPEDTLKRLSTAALLESCLSYPLMLDFLASNNMKTGFEHTYNAFNGFQELMKRPDFAGTLIRYYKNLDIAKARSLPTIAEQGHYSYKVCVTELFFGTNAFVSKMGAADSKPLVALLLDKLNVKNKLADIYGASGHITAAYALANVMATGERRQDILKIEGGETFKAELVFKNGNVLNEIISLAKAFIQ